MSKEWFTWAYLIATALVANIWLWGDIGMWRPYVSHTGIMFQLYHTAARLMIVIAIWPVLVVGLCWELLFRRASPEVKRRSSERSQ
jgi:hypothetical protein